MTKGGAHRAKPEVSQKASKEVEKGQNPESRAKLYDRMVQRYASSIGYSSHRMDTGMDIQYELHRK